MKQLKKITLTLAALLSMTAGAWAQESNEITLTPVTGQQNQWTFTMPAGNVELTPIYAPELTAAFKAGNSNTIQGGKATVTVTEKDATSGKQVTLDENGKYSPLYGEETITLTAAAGYKFKSVSVEVKKGAATTPLDNTTTAWTAGTFAVPAGGLTYSDAITVSGDVTLVLTDGETLTLNKGISLASGATLTIQGNGAMVVNGTNNSTASTVAGSTGTLILTSGTLTATGGNGAGVGDRSRGTDNRANAGGNAINGNVTVSGGTLIAIGGNGGSIGEKSEGAYGAVGGVAISGSVTVTGGTVTATGGNGGSIGEKSSDSNGGSGGAAIGGDAAINDGTWTASDGTHGANGKGQGGDGGKAVAGTIL